jgi:hypothetical protein
LPALQWIEEKFAYMKASSRALDSRQHVCDRLRENHLKKNAPYRRRAQVDTMALERLWSLLTYFAAKDY